MSELERIHRRLTRIGRGRPELAACDLRNIVPGNPFIDSIFDLYDTGTLMSPTNQPTNQASKEVVRSWMDGWLSA